MRRRHNRTSATRRPRPPAPQRTHLPAAPRSIVNWAPGLALRGKTGSVARAYHAVRAERTQIMVHFFIVVIGFVFQTIVAIWYFLLPNNPSATQANGAGGLNLVPPAVIVSFIAGCMLLSTLLYAKRIHTRFFGKRSVRSAGPSWMRGLPWVIERSASEKEQDEGVEVEGMMAEGSALTGGARTPGRGAGLNQRRAGKGRGDELDHKNMPLLDNPVTVIESHPDVATYGVGGDIYLGADGSGGSGVDSPSANRMIMASMSDYEMAGILSKRNDTENELPAPLSGKGAGKRTVKFFRRGSRQLSQVVAEMKDAVVGEWRDRFFVLHDGRLGYWASEADHAAGKPPNTQIDLYGYEVLVDMSDAKWGFTLETNSTLDSRRSVRTRSAPPSTPPIPRCSARASC